MANYDYEVLNRPRANGWDRRRGFTFDGTWTCLDCNLHSDDPELFRKASGRNAQYFGGRYNQCKQCAAAYCSRRRVEVVAIVRSFKDQPCMDCGNRFPPVCMDFDHRPGETKIVEVSHLANRIASPERIRAEIAKCDLVCANCHRLRTEARR